MMRTEEGDQAWLKISVECTNQGCSRAMELSQPFPKRSRVAAGAD